MKHYGDITKISGYDVPIVDVITGGSPCQDLSVAGKRAGLDGERSGLFMEQIRIVKEMREHDRTVKGSDVNIRPRYMVWENVPGAFSSNQGKDFQAVLTEIVRIAESQSPDVPMPQKGRWAKSGCLYDEMGGWSVAWRVHDAQFWGVPQRRKRISLVADFAGLSAAEILFERKGLRRDFAESGETREGITASTESGTDSAISFQERAGKPGGGKGILIQHERTGALSTLNNQSVYSISSYASNAMKSANPHSGIYEAETARTIDNNGGNPACNQGGMIVLEGNGSRPSHKGDGCSESETMYTLNSTEQHAVVMTMQAFGQYKQSEQASALKQRDHKDATDLVIYGLNDRASYNESVAPIRAKGGDCGFGSENLTVRALCSTDYKGIRSQNVDQAIVQKVTGPLMASGYQKNGTQEAANDMYITTDMVRRLTPLECERLQGFPDGWTDIGEWTDTKGKKHKESDTPRYKALGNSIALPFWAYLARRICAQYERQTTMASLFDGIGGFPLVFERSGAKAVWASEIEEFPIAVTKKHFPEEG